MSDRNIVYVVSIVFALALAVGLLFLHELETIRPETQATIVKTTINESVYEVAVFCKDVNFGRVCHEVFNKQLVGGVYGIPDLDFGASSGSDASFDNSISSLGMMPGYEVTLYRDKYFEGASKTFTANASYVGDDFDDRASSVRVMRIGMGETN